MYTGILFNFIYNLCAYLSTVKVNEMLLYTLAYDCACEHKVGQRKSRHKRIHTIRLIYRKYTNEQNWSVVLKTRKTFSLGERMTRKKHVSNVLFLDLEGRYFAVCTLWTLCVLLCMHVKLQLKVYLQILFSLGYVVV